MGMPFSIRLGNRNPGENGAARRVGGGFAKPYARRSFGVFEGSRGVRTVRASAGPACVSVGQTPRETRVSTRGRSLVTTAATFFAFSNKKCGTCACVSSLTKQNYPNGAQSTFFACRANVSASTSEVPSSTKFHLRNAWWRASHLELRCRRSVGRTRPRARHPRARARGARAGGRPAPVAPVSAVSRRCSCSGSPRSPSRA